ncbi:hypothetical protein TSUD_159450 [Trifolium subterraneum]|uniref:Uncharacterized protein n=1 Tax=Trifolium subterraneum TaxID=3900 RepID=A0A2Z6MFD5_TRISU|nr:hypothetical protein TSUD_159450 [Trifolium subterraneum]
MEAALNRIGVRLSMVVCLPYMAKECNIDKNKIPQLDWPTILVYFSCCVLVLFKKFTDEASHSDFMSRCICELREIVGYDPDAKLDIPFHFKRANVIKIMLGSCLTLCRDHFILINDVLVKSQSPVLIDDRVLTEVEDYIRLVKLLCLIFLLNFTWAYPISVKALVNLHKSSC